MTLPSRSEVEQKLASFEGCTPGPWGACKDGDCVCGQVWSHPADHPVAEVTIGKWGDSYPAVRVVSGEGLHGSHAEAYMERIDYGEVPEAAAHANARLIAAAPKLVEWVRELSAEVERLGEQLQRESDSHDRLTDLATRVVGERDKANAQLAAADLPSRFQIGDDVSCRGSRWTVEWIGFSTAKINYSLRHKSGGNSLTVPSEEVFPTPAVVA